MYLDKLSKCKFENKSNRVKTLGRGKRLFDRVWSLEQVGIIEWAVTVGNLKFTTFIVPCWTYSSTYNTISPEKKVSACKCVIVKNAKTAASNYHEIYKY